MCCNKRCSVTICYIKKKTRQEDRKCVKNVWHAEISPVKRMKNVHEYIKMMCPYIKKKTMLQQRRGFTA